MSYNACCVNASCTSYLRVREVTDEDEYRNWNYCFSCSGDLKRMENYDEYNSKEVFTCENRACLSHADPVYLNLMQLEQCQDFCEVCGNQLIEYAKFDMPGLDDDNQKDITELMEESEHWTKNLTKSCIDYAESWNKLYLLHDAGLVDTVKVEKKDKYPVVYMSAGLKSPASD